MYFIHVTSHLTNTPKKTPWILEAISLVWLCCLKCVVCRCDGEALPHRGVRDQNKLAFVRVNPFIPFRLQQISDGPASWDTTETPTLSKYDLFYQFLIVVQTRCFVWGIAWHRLVRSASVRTLSYPLPLSLNKIRADRIAYNGDTIAAKMQSVLSFFDNCEYSKPVVLFGGSLGAGARLARLGTVSLGAGESFLFLCVIVEFNWSGSRRVQWRVQSC